MRDETPPDGQPAEPADRHEPSTMNDRPWAAKGPPAEQLLTTLWAEQCRLWPRGEGVPARDYLRRYPALAADAERAAVLIYHEFVVREGLGGAPPFADYLRDYAPYAPHLNALRAEDSPAGPHPAAIGRLGDYELLEEVGRGGMGVVYKARQMSLGRVVAVKRLVAGPWATPGAVGRLIREAEVAARLQHPNIVAVHEVGADAGQPYFSMDFVEGTSLAALARANPLPAARAAAYVRTLAEAVHYAHGQGILHRDLKPANVLIDADDRPRITDFGLAKRLEGGASLTATGDLLGTPGYMPPEQATGQHARVGPAADVYSLGAILYELLTGRPPFRAETPLDTLKQVVEAEPAAPRVVNPAVPRDLETVCLKCLNKEPARRYASAAALADDLGRFLKGEPIQARPVRRWEHAWRWGRQHPGMAGLLGAVATLGVAVVTTALVAALTISAKNRELVKTANSEAAAREQGQKDFRHALAAVQTLIELGSSPELRKSGLEGFQAQLLAKGKDFYERFITERQADPSLRWELANAYAALGAITDVIGSKEKAVQSYERAVELFEEWSHDNPADAVCQHQLAQTYNQLGALYRSIGRPDRTEEVYGQASVILNRLAAAQPEDTDLLRKRATLYNDLGVLYRHTDRPDQARAEYEKALEIQERLWQARPDDASIRRELARSYANLGTLYTGAWRGDLGEPYFRKALEHWKQLAQAHPKTTAFQYGLADCLNNLGFLYGTIGSPQKAEEAYRHALQVCDRLTREHPLVNTYQHELARTRHRLGGVYVATGRKDQAETAFREAIAIEERLVRQNPEVNLHANHLAWFCLDLADLTGEAGRTLDALESLNRSITLLAAVRKRARDDPTANNFLPTAYRRRIELLTQLGRHAEAIQDWDRLIDLYEGEDERAILRLSRASARARLGEHARAVRDAEEETSRPGKRDARWYAAAQAYSLAAAAAAKDDRLPTADRQKLAESNATRAVELLAKARAAGYFNAPANRDSLRKDPDLAPLRSRPDFQKLLADE